MTAKNPLDENPANRAWRLFREHAAKLGFCRKVYGDNAFTNRRGQYIKMWSARDGMIQIHQDGRGRYQISDPLSLAK